MTTLKENSASLLTSRHNGNLVSSLFRRQLLPEKLGSSCVLNPSYRSLIRKSFRRATSNARKIFKTKTSANSEVGGDINPVYDIAYSPVCYQNHRVVAVADELGYMSLIKVAFEGRDKVRKGLECGDDGEQVYNRGVQTVSSTSAIREQTEDEMLFGNEEPEPLQLQPVLYTLAWNWDGNKILTGYGDGSIRIWDLEKSARPTCAATIHAFEKSLKRVAWCQENLISCSRTNEILVHDLRMRNPLTNRIDCSQLSSKLTDISVLSDVYVVASSSNQSAVNLFDLRYTYKLYKRIKPVQSFDLSSPGYTTLKYDKLADDGLVYALGSDSVVRSFDFRSGVLGATYQVPGGVDFFTKIDVDRFSGVLVSGGSGESAWGFDLSSTWEKGSHLMPFFELREGKRVNWEGERQNENGGEESDKENQPGEGDAQTNDDGSNNNGRSSSAVALGTRRGSQDCAFQIACGGDNSAVLVYD